uniref:TRAF3-interacting protein 1 N-terminal domain-containing protein n=1 Tax=Periophthalmus magnuspinnatus TaxID=409849 RepID=A0A3B4ASY7_9GOBI
MDPAVVRRTQENLGRVIRKPQLSDKYLNKPPFRFLHDIISEVRVYNKKQQQHSQIYRFKTKNNNLTRTEEESGQNSAL